MKRYSILNASPNSQLYLLSPLQIIQKIEPGSMGNNTNTIKSSPIIISLPSEHFIVSSTRNPPSKISLKYFQPLHCDSEEPDCEEETQIIIQQQPETIEITPQLQEVRVKWKNFLKMREGNFLQQYDVMKQLGRGGFGCVYKVKGRYTGIVRAAKKIKKSDLSIREHERLLNEVAILQSLDHPNICKIYEVYDQSDSYVLIIELCEGGQLFKRISKNQINKQQAARVTRQLLEALVYVHSRGIVHRDIKPQNILFQRETESMKLIDFGIAVRKSPDETLTSRIGTAYYIAPEVLCKKYDQRCDEWAAGVCLYMMLLHRPPFVGSNQNQIMESILKDDVRFEGRQWMELPKDCKELLNGLMRKKPKERLTAGEALKNPWLSQHGKGIKAIKNYHSALDKMQDFGFRSRLEAVVYTYAVSQLLTNQQKLGLQQAFKRADKDSDGCISLIQFRQIMKDRIKDEQRLTSVMRLIDLDGSGNIQYTQFLVAALNPSEYLKRQHYQKAFEYFDIDHSGGITYEQVAQFLQGNESQQSIRRIFENIDINGDGNISRQEFVQLFMRETLKTTLQNRAEPGNINSNKKQNMNDSKKNGMKSSQSTNRENQKINKNKKQRESIDSSQGSQRSSKRESLRETNREGFVKQLPKSNFGK